MDRKSEQLSEALRSAGIGIPVETLEEITRALLEHGAADRRLPCDELYALWARYVWQREEVPEGGWLDHCFRWLRGALFPHLGIPEDAAAFGEDRESLLKFLHAYFGWERTVLPFDPTKDFRLLSDAEIRAQGYTKEYLKLKSLADRMYIYEFMRIGADITPFNTLGHICGVHYVAMYVARQLAKAGVPVDLGLVSAAAASHDIGKYGCRKKEERRVPYLHYYYTDYCLSGNGLPIIAHIAANHSTWDLELEDLSVESLLLIYADFRTKSTREEGKEIIHFYSLAESFDVILSKLDNVDAAKRHRYTKVYAKLSDFEAYMREHGVQTEIPDQANRYPEACPEEPVPVRREIALLAGEDVVEQIKQRAMDHNIRLMSRFNSPEEFGSLLESARSEVDWKRLRTYISILQEYFTYMTESQKLTSLSFLYEMLPHPQSDIRLHAAIVMGQIVAGFREEYKKELPEDVPAADINTTNLALFRKVLEDMFHPDHKYTEQHRRWMIQRVDAFVQATVENCRDSCRPKYFDILEEYYDPALEPDTLLELLSTALRIRAEFCPDAFRDFLGGFCRQIAGKHGARVDLCVLRVLLHHGLMDAEEERELRYKVLGLPMDGLSDDQLSTIFLDDLKSHVSWSTKVANVSVLLETAQNTSQKSRLLHIAAHFANLIKVSETVTVRREAGDALLAIIDRMSADQRNEIVIDLFNGLEIEDYQFSRFIPDYLGIILHYLPLKEMDEVIDALEKMLEAGNPQTAGSALNTIAIVLRQAVRIGCRQGKAWGQRRSRLLGILMKGFVHYRKRISREAFRAIGEHLFETEILTLAEKHEVACHCLKRILTLLPGREEVDELAFYNNAAMLNHIYRFISEYQSKVGEFRYPAHRRVAFFPGTFDPFSQGHKAIATTIRDMGFEVYLAIDEFSWSKKTLPHMLRKSILAMSAADEEDLCIFPDDVSVNIANPKDMKRLRDLFLGKELYIAVGSDVIDNASCYQKTPEECSIHTFNHIVFARESKKLDADGERFPITGDVIRLSLEKYYEDISSTRIRENIDLGRDIGSLIDPIVQNYIYDRNFYSREPAYKHVMQAQNISIHRYSEGESVHLGSMQERLSALQYDCGQVTTYLNQPEVQAISIETGSRTLRRYAVAGAREVESRDLLKEFGDLSIASHIRSSNGGKIAVIGMFHAFHTPQISNIRQMLLTELMTELAARDFTYAVYHPVCEAGYDQTTLNVFRWQGFRDISGDADQPVLACDLRDPIVIFRDAETVIKAPLNKNQRVQKVLDNAHDQLLTTLREIYPGKLLLSFNTNAVYSKIIRLVAEDNKVSLESDPLRRRGPYMSVPFGKALSDVVVPNTVTKALRTEKYFRNDLSGFDIHQSRDYQSLNDQARTLRSFDRPAILIDDLLHSGQRMNKIDPILREHDVMVRKIIVGLLTGNARDEMAVRGREVESAYFIPSIGMWLNEKDCYPFIGGDSIEPPEGAPGEAGRGESINLLFPFTGLCPVGDGDVENIYRYSMTCLNNAADILRVLEAEYQKEFEKKLTLRRLGAVIVSPRHPVLGEGVSYDEHVAPSQYVENEIRKADRLHLFYRGNR